MSRRTRAANLLACSIPRGPHLTLEFGSPRDQIANEVICIVVGNAQVWHVYVAIFLSQRHGDGVLLRLQLFWMLDLTHQPVAVAHVGHARKVGTNFVSLSHRMACAALLGEKILPGIKMN